jgi:DNA-binding IclR family transcriptional regulator
VAAVKSARRTIEIFEVFAETHRPASASEMARHLGAPLSSTSVLLAGLARLGYLEQDPGDRSYRPTLRVMLLGGWLQDRLLLTLRRFAVEPRLEKERMRAGMLRPITRAAVGKALLMLKPDEEVARLLLRANAEERDAAHRVSRGTFLADLHRSRERGWTESAGSMRAGLSVLAMPLPPLPDQPSLAIGIGGEHAGIEARQEELVRALQEVCRLLAGEATCATQYGVPG